MFAFINDDNQVTQWPVTAQDIRAAYPGISFPSSITSVELDGLDVVIYTPVQEPEFNPRTQKLVELAPHNVDGFWQQNWSVEDLTDSEVALINEIRANTLRQERNNLLLASDWTQLLDSTVDQQAWAVYRQQLRDLPQSAGFPWEVEWPYAPDHYFSPDNQ